MNAADAGGSASTVRIADGIAEIDAQGWDALAGEDNPFLSHAFLAALEESGSVGRGTGWQPAPFAAEGEGLLGALPAYLKSHSQGEYVFDHAWADAWARAGGNYYPKIQIAAPFTPVPGPRILARSPETAAQLLSAVENCVAANGFSSAHATFVEEAQLQLFMDAGWMIRQGIQYHWFNQGYEDFDAFLDTLASRKRKTIRKERASSQKGVSIRHLTGAEITESHWDAFWEFYQDTGARKWGRPYLTREFFSIIGQTMADRLILIFADVEGMPIAGALNFLGKQALYGRYWGCRVDKPFLHFELCYYQAIEIAIERKLSRVEAGAQGEHKLARGYIASPTWSAHYIPHPAFREAIADFLQRETRAVERDIEFLGELTPFKRG